MRITLLVLLTITVCLAGCGGGSNTESVSNANSANSTGSSNTSASQGVGPKDTGIGGTSDSQPSTVNGNPRVEPPGAIKNGNTTTNSGRP